MSKPSAPINAAFSGLTVLKADLKKQAQIEKLKAEQQRVDAQTAKIAACSETRLKVQKKLLRKPDFLRLRLRSY
jgi:hypothetical protein